MPVSIATKLGIQFARFAAASGNAGSASFRNAFNNATAGSSTSASSSSWAQGLSSGGSAANGAGIGGAKFQAGRGAHSTFSQSGRAIVNANASSSHDAANSVGDDEDELAAQQARIHRPGHLHRSGLLGRSWSQSQSVSPIRSTRKRQTSTTLPALQLILPRGTQLVHSPSQSPRQRRTLTTSAPTNELLSDDVRLSSDQTLAAASLSVGTSDPLGFNALKSHSSIPRRHTRSHSVSAAGPSNQFDSSDALDILDALRKEPEIAHAHRQRSDKKDDHAARLIEAATQSGDWMAVLESVRQYCLLDRSQQSVYGFNLALEALLNVRKDHRDPNTVLSCYLQMTESGFRPDARTFSAVVIALCRQDESLQALHRNERKAGVHLGEEFAHAMSLFNLAHAAHLGFTNAVPYNHLIRGCGHRGDVRQARIVLESFIRKAGVRTSARTFSSLIDCVSRDNSTVANEDQAQRSTRILKSCQRIFDEFQTRRGEDTVLGDPVLVWNALITASFDHSDVTRALGLVDGMLQDAEVLKNPSPPHPDRLTSSTVITRLAKRGDLASSLDWIEKLFKLNEKGRQAQAIVEEPASSEEEDVLVDSTAHGPRQMPLPDLKSLIYVLNLATTVPGEHVTSTQAWANLVAPADILEHSIKVNAVTKQLFEAYNGLDTIRASEAVALGSIFKRNLVWQESILRDNIENGRKESADALLDSTLPTVRAFFDLPVNHLTGALRATFADMLPAMFALLEVAYVQLRIEDSASLFTYAIQCQILSLEEVPEEGTEAWMQIHSVFSPKFKKLAHMRHTKSDSSEIGFRPFVQAMEVTLPAMHSLNLDSDSSDAKLLLSDYHFARKHFAAAELPLNALGWNTFVDLLTLYERQVDAAIENGALTILSDLTGLPEEVRAELDLSDLVAVLQSKYAEVANSELERLGLLEPVLRSDESAGSPDTMAQSSASSKMTDMTAESLLEGYVAPLSVKSAASPISLLSSLPAIQVVDEDLAISLQKLDGGVNAPAGLSIPPNPNAAYDQLMSTIHTEGAYPSVEAISQMLVSAGRASNMDRVHQLYVIGCHVLGSFVGHAEWQMDLWQELESSMVCALAHGGDAKAASEHRHRLINAGCVPSVDAYASLIAVVRDTTDDAMIAEELFEESQRLGVEPNVFLYNTVISKLCRARKLERAMQLFNEMRRRGLRPSSVTYGSMINGFTRTGDEENAEAMFTIMENAPRFRAKAPPYNNMIQFYTYNRPDRQKAMMYFDKLQQHRVEPTGYTYKLSLDVHGVIEPVDVPGMEHVFGQLIADPNVAVEGNHWGSIITTHGVKAGNLDKAIELFECIPTHFASRKIVRGRGSKSGRSAPLPDAVVYEALLNVFLHHGRTDLMRVYVNRMRESGIQATAYLANVMIKGLAFKPESGTAEEEAERGEGLLHARALFAEMDDPPMGVAAVGNHPINHRHHANDATAANVIQPQNSPPEDGASNVFGFKGVLREPSTFETMIRAELLHGNNVEASLLLDRMRFRGYPPALMAKAEALLDFDQEGATAQEAAPSLEAGATSSSSFSTSSQPRPPPPHQKEQQQHQYQAA